MIINYVEAGARLRKLRTEKGITREVMAEKCDTSTTTLAKLESGNFGVNCMIFLSFCKAIDTTPDHILYGFKTNTEIGEAAKADQEVLDLYSSLGTTDKFYICDIMKSLLMYRNSNKIKNIKGE